MNTTSTRSAPTASPAARVPRPTSATGTSTSSAPRGFTLVEVLVVLLIIGVLAAGAMLSLGVIGGGDRPLQNERDRLDAALTYLREQAELQNREFGLRCHDGGYEFVVWEPRLQVWERLVDDRLLQSRALPEGLELTLRVDGRQVVLPKADALDLAPQVPLWSSGDLGAFELVLRREGDGPGFRITPNVAEDALLVAPVEAGARS